MEEAPKPAEPPKTNEAPTPAATPGPKGNGIPGYRAEPKLHNAGWGPRSEGGEAGTEYAKQVTGSDESLYIKLQDPSVGGGGTGFVELDGLTPDGKTHIDAKDSPKRWYDVSGAFKDPPDKFTAGVKVPKIIEEAIRQGWAKQVSGAEGIEWRISNEAAAKSLQQLFAREGITITVKYVPKGSSTK
jgi:hypothetical protein